MEEGSDQSGLRLRGSSELSDGGQAGPMTVGALVRALSLMFPPSDAESWDRTGLLVGDAKAQVSAVACALDPTPEAIVQAHALGANVLLTHHPVFLDPPTLIAPRASGASASGAAVFEAVSRGVALANYHTALDVSAQAQAMLPGMLRLERTGVLVPLERDDDMGYGQICALPAAERGTVTLAGLASRATAVFGRAPRVWGDMGRDVERIVTWTGSAAGATQACLARGVDTLVCGELKYHEALDAAGAGLCIVELGHDASELPFAAVLAQAAARAGVPHEAIRCLDQSANWTYPEARRA